MNGMLRLLVMGVVPTDAGEVLWAIWITFYLTGVPS
jgi:hypothetical protein